MRVQPASRVGMLMLLCASLGASVALAQTTDLASIVIVPQHDQSAADADRDRYECHNWAVEQTGAQPVRAEASGEAAETRARRVDKVLLGAAVGAAVGGLVRGSGRRAGYDEAADGALGGAVLGAAAGAIAGRDSAKAARGEDRNGDYLRALSACLEARAYSVVVPVGG